MAVRPETLSTRSGDVAIAYQVTGDGPFDVVFVPPFVTHVELVWTTSFAPDLRALSSFCRLIRFDKRGTDMSDRVGGAPTLETRMDDARAVTDAAGSGRAAFFGSSVGAAMSLLFGRDVPGPDGYARHEERLSPHDVGARLPVAPDRGGVPPRDGARSASLRATRLGTGGRALATGSWEEAEPDRVLATVLFTDIVGSSERAASLGDRAWRELPDVDTAGDGFFASFNGPARAIRCACSSMEGVRELGLDIRAGLHTGEWRLYAVER